MKHPLDIPRIGFELLSIFDWVTPLVKMADIIDNDPPFGLNSWTFYIPNTEAIHRGWSVGHIKRLLQKNGVRVYGDMVQFGEITLAVPVDQAGRAEDILDKYEIPLKKRSQGAPRPQRQRSSLFPDRAARCAYCGSFDVRKGKCHNCGGIS